MPDVTPQESVEKAIAKLLRAVPAGEKQRAVRWANVIRQETTNLVEERDRALARLHEATVGRA